MNARQSFDRPAPLCYHAGELNRCPQCGGKSWEVGRMTAECGGCGHPLPLAEAAITMAPAKQADAHE